MKPVKHTIPNQNFYYITEKGLVTMDNPNRGRIRRALCYTAGVVFGVAMLWAVCWGMAIACVLAGGTVQVCGL